MVASFAEAWIEKTNIIKICKFPEVASFAEAWIENSYSKQFSQNMSRLLRGGVD